VRKRKVQEESNDDDDDGSSASGSIAKNLMATIWPEVFPHNLLGVLPHDVYVFWKLTQQTNPKHQKK
jgi:hypothetical protein